MLRKHASACETRAIRLVPAAVVAAFTFTLAGCGAAHRHPWRAPPPPAPSPRTRALDLPVTTSNIHIGLAFDYQLAQSRATVRNVDYVFGADFLDWRLRAVPGVAHNDSYLPFDTDAYPQSAPGHSLSDWKAKHPSWIVYRCDRRTPAYYGGGNTNVPLDFSNPAVQAYDIREARELLVQGAGGVGFDDFTFTNHEGRCGVYRNGRWVSLRYPGIYARNAKYDDDMLAWLRAVSTALRHEFPRKTLAINIGFFRSGLANLEQAARYVDLVFDESGFTDYGTRNLSGSSWQKEVDALEYLDRAGVAFDVNGIVDAPSEAAVTPAEISWVLGNYLLVKGTHSYTYIYAGNHRGFTGSPSDYGTFYDRPQYHVQIGQPVSPLQMVGGLAVRRYSGGLVVVNPSESQTLSLALGAGYQDIFGVPHDSVQLGPTSAIVLLGRGTRPGAVGS